MSQGIILCKISAKNFGDNWRRLQFHLFTLKRTSPLKRIA